MGSSGSINKIIVYFLIYNIKNMDFKELKDLLVNYGMNESRIQSMIYNRDDILEQINIEDLTVKQRYLLAIYIIYYVYSYDKNVEKNVKILNSLRKLKLDTSYVFFVKRHMRKVNFNVIMSQQSVVESIVNPNKKLRLVINSIVIKSVKAGKYSKKYKMPSLKSISYEHEVDRYALEKLKNTTGLDSCVKAFYSYGVEKLDKITYTGSNIKVNSKNYPELYSMFLEACSILGMKYIPDLYIAQGFINAFTKGVERPIVVITSGCLSALTYDEMMFLLGHELGHIKSEHVLYHTIGSYFPMIVELIANFTVGLGLFAAKPIEIALFNWIRKSEFTADRAGLLCCQNYEAAVTTFMKIAGAPIKYYDRLNTREFLEQAREFSDLDEDGLNKVIKVFSALYNSHPWTVLRAKELDNWIKLGCYEEVINKYKDKVTPLAINS